MTKENEPSAIRKFADKAGIVFSVGTLLGGGYFLGKAALAGEVGKMIIPGIFVGLDLLQIAERDKPMEKRSPLNPSRWVNALLKHIESYGRPPANRLAMAAA